MPDSYSSQLGVILAIESSDKDYLLSGVCILRAMSFKPPLSDRHLTSANIIIIINNISSLKPQQCAALAELSPCMVQAGVPGADIIESYQRVPSACGQRCQGPLPGTAGAGGLHHNR